MSHPQITVEPWDLPVSVDAEDAGLFLDYIAASNEMVRHDSGTELFHDEPAESLVWMLDTKYRVRVGLVAHRDDVVVGFAAVSWSRSTQRKASFSVVVRPELRDDAVSDALMAAVEEVARTHGRRVLETSAMVRADASGERLVSPTGAGSVPLEDHSTRMLLRHGFRLGQVERVSTFDLHGSYARTDELLAAALAHAGGDYEAVWWQLPTPPEHAAGYAEAIGRMETDVPAGHLECEEDPWTAERLLDRDATLLQAGRTMAVTAVIHRPTQQVAAFNELSIGVDLGDTTDNWGTLVMPEHRGHRLGTVVKCLGLRRWHELVPTSPVVQTFNAEENRYMLDVNEAVGFEAVASSGEWTKTLDG